MFFSGRSELWAVKPYPFRFGAWSTIANLEVFCTNLFVPRSR